MVYDAQKEPQERETEMAATKVYGVLKIVKQFSRPATFKSIKIDLFVMRADPFGLLQAWNLREMAVSIRKTETEIERWCVKQGDERKGAAEREKDFNLVIVSAFLNPFKKTGGPPALRLWANRIPTLQLLLHVQANDILYLLYVPNNTGMLSDKGVVFCSVGAASA